MKTLRINLEDIKKEGFKIENIDQKTGDLRAQATSEGTKEVAKDAQKGKEGGTVPQGNSLMSYLPILIMILAFYLLIIRPGQKKQKELKDQIEKIKKDDKILTSGGIIAVVDKVEENEVILKVDDKTKITVSKSYIVLIYPPLTPVK